MASWERRENMAVVWWGKENGESGAYTVVGRCILRL